jgi:hypothetical protein
MLRCLTFSLLIATNVVVFGQRGFMNKHNFLSADVYSAAYKGKYGLSYDFCVSNSAMLKASANIFKITYSTLTPSVDSYYDLVNYESYKISSSTSSFSGYSWEIGADFSFYSYTGMPVPVGYFMGIYYERVSGNMIEKCEAFSEQSYFRKDTVFHYKSRMNTMKYVYGRNTYLFKNIILTTSLQFGLSAGKYELLGEDGLNKPPQIILPYLTFFRKNTNYRFISTYAGNSTRYGFFSIYLMPEIKIGFIF